MELHGSVAVVIGASAGIGRAYALALAGSGATVIAAARTLGPFDGSENNTLANVVEAGRSLPGRICAQVCDVLIEQDIQRLIDETVVNFGRIDVLVNNAAWMMTTAPFDISDADWDKVMHINIRAPYHAIRAAAPHMMRQKSGSIINITAKVGGFMSRGAREADETLFYGLSKAALNRLSFFMSEELKPYGVAVNALSPGVVATDTALAATPNIRDYGAKEPTPEVLGPALLYLARQNAETMTGQILHTDEFEKTWPQST